MAQLAFAIGEKVNIRGKDRLFEAKIVEILNQESEDPTYVVHFKGRSSKNNRKVLHSESNDVLFKYEPQPPPADKADKKGEKKKDQEPGQSQEQEPEEKLDEKTEERPAEQLEETLEEKSEEKTEEKPEDRTEEMSEDKTEEKAEEEREQKASEPDSEKKIEPEPEKTSEPEPEEKTRPEPEEKTRPEPEEKIEPAPEEKTEQEPEEMMEQEQEPEKTVEPELLKEQKQEPEKTVEPELLKEQEQEPEKTAEAEQEEQPEPEAEKKMEQEPEAEQVTEPAQESVVPEPMEVDPVDSSEKVDEDPAVADEQTSNEKHAVLPERLAQMLIDDRARLNDGFLNGLPARHTMKSIVDMYLSELRAGKIRVAENVNGVVYTDSLAQRKTDYAIMRCTMQGLGDFFDDLFESRLLYPSERAQYETLVIEKVGSEGLGPARKTERKFFPSEYYGLPHLLRLIDNFESIRKLRYLPERNEKQIDIGIKTFVIFLNNNIDKFNHENDYIEKPIVETEDVEMQDESEQPGPSNQ